MDTTSWIYSTIRALSQLVIEFGVNTFHGIHNTLMNVQHLYLFINVPIHGCFQAWLEGKPSALRPDLAFRL